MKNGHFEKGIKYHPRGRCMHIHMYWKVWKRESTAINAISKNQRNKFKRTSPHSYITIIQISSFKFQDIPYFLSWLSQISTIRNCRKSSQKTPNTNIFTSKWKFPKTSAIQISKHSNIFFMNFISKTYWKTLMTKSPNNWSSYW